MVETITPVVHGGRRSRWALFLVLHVAGATVAAASFGALLGGAGALLDAPWGRAGPWIVALVAALYLVSEAIGIEVPVPQLRRQVPDWWRTFFPFGPAAFLYGVGLGVGFFTYLAHGTLVVVAAAAVAGGRPFVGAALLAPFGLARGLSAIVARGARTADEGSSLVGALARSASWVGWRVAHAAVLAAVLGTALMAGVGRMSTEIGAVAGSVVAVVFGAAAIAKLSRPARWRRSLASYRLPPRVERTAAIGVPVTEGVLAVMPFLGLASSAGLAALSALAVFSVAVVAARVRVGRRLDCGCFGASQLRDYRWLLARNVVLGVVAAVAWRRGVDESVVAGLGLPTGGELLPAALAVLGVALAAWAGLEAVAARRRGAIR